MTAKDKLQKGFEHITNETGKICRFRYFEQTIGSVWDDDRVLTQKDPDIWISGIILPINKLEGTKDYVLVEQGKIAPDDLRLFVSGCYSIGSLDYLTVTGSNLSPDSIQGDYSETTQIINGSPIFSSGDAQVYLSSSGGPEWLVVDQSIPGFAVWSHIGSVTGSYLPYAASTYNESGVAVITEESLPYERVLFGGSELSVKIQLGSPTGDNYSIVPEGIIDHEVSNTSIFKKAYIRRLTNGSLMGE